MKEIKNNRTVYLEDYDITVNCFLTYAQIQQIVNAVIKFDIWSEREQCKDMLILYHATDIPKEVLEEKEHNDFLSSGILGDVYKHISNINQLNEALEYTESTYRAVAQILKRIDEIAVPKKDKVKKSKGE